ncbi:MAG: MFS transporter [Firmicutes bacterium]|nr:MFS transporter [Bacillota bacterium]
MAKKPLSKALKYLYGIGDFLGDLSMSLRTYYWSFFITTVVGVPLPLQAAFAPIRSTISLIMQPFYGIILDSIKPMKWGRYRSIYLVFTPIYAVLVCMSWAFGLFIKNYTILMTVILIQGIIFNIFFQMLYTANVAIIGVITDNDADKALLASHRWAAINLCKVALGFIVPPLLTFFGARQSNPQMPYVTVAVILASLSLFGYMVHFKITEGYEETDSVEESDSKKKKAAGIKDIFKAIFTNPPLLALFCGNIFTTTTSFTFTTLAVYYYNYVVDLPEMMAFYLTATNFFAVAGSLLSSALTKRFPLKTVSVSALLGGVICLAIARVFAYNALGFTIAICFFQFCAATNYPCFITMYTNCALYAEWKTGTKATAAIVGVSNLPVTISGTINGILIPLALNAVGFDASLEILPPTVKTGIANLVTLLPLSYYVMAFIIIAFVFKLSQETMQKIIAELDARKQAAN